MVDVVAVVVAAHVEVVAELGVAAAMDVSPSLFACAAEWAMPAPVATNAAALAAAVMRRARWAG